MQNTTTIQIIQLPTPGMEALRAEAVAEGYDFIDTLFKEWASGENRFSRQGEALCGYVEDGLLVAVGGLAIDPYISSGEVGRIRRVYVRAAWRNRGIGRALMVALIDKSREGFGSVRLRAVNEHAARLYERIGFSPIVDPDATHSLRFD